MENNQPNNCEESNVIKNKQFRFLSGKDCISYERENYFLNGKELSSPTDKEDSKIAFQNYITLYLHKLTSHFENIAVLCGAGTSIENGKNRGKDRAGLWEECKDEIGNVKDKVPDFETKEKDKDIEGLLSYLLLYKKLKITESEEVSSVIESLEKKIVENCKLFLDVTNHLHEDFLNKLTARNPSEPRVQLFTTNYDCLFEQAANHSNVILMDGFSFTSPSTFSGRNFDYDIVYRDKTRLKQEESFVPKVIQFYKIHGSLDWDKEDEERIVKKQEPTKPCIIYPASNKYEASYEQPFFEMMSRFQQVLRKESTLLIVIGFGFKDKHIQNAIKEAVEQNPNFHLVIVCYDKEKEYIDNERFKDYLNGDQSKSLPNVSIIFSKFSKFVEMYPINKSYYEEMKDENN